MDMNALIRLAVVVTVLLPLAVLCCFGFRFACDPEELRSLLRVVRHREECQQAQQALLRRVESKEQVVRDVIAQQCSLSEALARLQELDREFDRECSASIPKLAEIHAWKWPSEVEGHYRYIIAMVKSRLDDRPEEAAVVLRRLEKEYQQLQTNTQTHSTAPMERPERHR
jgi:hypothetical protein